MMTTHDPTEALLSELIEGSSDLDSREAQAAMAKAGVSRDELLELRRVANSVEFATALESSKAEDEAPGLGQVRGLVRELAAATPSARRSAGGGIRFRNAKLWALAAAALLAVLTLRFATSADEAPSEPADGSIDQRAVLGEGTEGPIIGTAAAIEVVAETRTFSIPYPLRPGDTVRVTLEVETGGEWRAIGSKEVESPRVTLRGEMWTQLHGALRAEGSVVRARFDVTSADGSPSERSPRRLSLAGPSGALPD